MNFCPHQEDDRERGGLHSFACNDGWSRGQKNEQQNKFSSPKNNAAAGYQGPVKIELSKIAGLLNKLPKYSTFFILLSLSLSPPLPH